MPLKLLWNAVYYVYQLRPCFSVLNWAQLRGPTNFRRHAPSASVQTLQSLLIYESDIPLWTHWSMRCCSNEANWE